MFDDDKGECKNRRNAHEQWTIFIFPGFSKTSNHWVNFYSGKWETTEMMILASRLLQLQKKKSVYVQRLIMTVRIEKDIKFTITLAAVDWYFGTKVI